MDAVSQKINDGLGSAKDHGRTAAKEGASYITLCPYTPPKTKKQKYTRSTVNFDSLFGPQSWTKYFEIESPIEDDFLLYNSLAEVVGADVLFRHQKNGVRIIEAASQEQSEKLQELVDTNNPELPVKKNETLNACHGTIIVPNAIETGNIEFGECSEKVKNNIKIQGHKIKSVSTYVRPARGSRKYPVRIAKITFEGRILPETVVVAGQRLTVREFIPPPRQCAKCWKFGHGIKYCKLDVYVCPVCSIRGHQKENCTQATKHCINCQGSHPSFSKSCLEYKKQQLITKTQFKEGLPYKAAVNKLKQTGEISAYNYKRALESKPPQTSTPKVPKATTANRFSVLDMEDPQNYGASKQVLPKSPPKITKRIRDSSSEEGGVSPKLNPKQKPKIKNQGSNIQEIVAEIHVNEAMSMDETIIFTDKDHERLNVGAGRTLTSGSTSSAVLPSESTPITVLPSELTPPIALPSEPSVPAIMPTETSITTVEPTAGTIPATIPSKAPLPTVVTSEAPLPTVVTSEAPLPTVVTSEAPLPSVVTLEAPLPTVVTSKASSPTMVLSAAALPTVTSKDSSQLITPSEATESVKVKCPKTVPGKNPGTDEIKNLKPQPTKNIKLGPKKKDSKIPSKISKSGTNLNRPKSLLRDYHMPPGFKDGN